MTMLRKQILPHVALLVVTFLSTATQGWILSLRSETTTGPGRCMQTQPFTILPLQRLHLHSFPIRLYASTTDTEQSKEPPNQAQEGTNYESSLSEEEWTIISDLHKKVVAISTSSGEDEERDAKFEAVVEEILPNLSPSLIMKLRAGESGLTSFDLGNIDQLEKFQNVATTLERILKAKLDAARDTLSELMDAGEIKRLDSLIGNAARSQKLDVAFFQVLQMNIKDAASDQQQTEVYADRDDERKENADSANRLQILQHIHTRCQEEMEKLINPGIALLSKLLRTEVDSIRRNQLEYYLCPQPTTITSPDGKRIELRNPPNQKSLVDHTDFCNAIGNAVLQIRTVENAGGTDQVVAANMVESCRQVAKEARIVIGEYFGRDSEELRQFEDMLMPVFRPSSNDSPYMKGEHDVATTTAS